MENRDRQEEDKLEHREKAARKLELQRHREEEEEFDLRDILRTDPRSLIANYNH